jgi:hypothetical protein
VGSRVNVAVGLFVGASVSTATGAPELVAIVGAWLGTADALCSGADVGVLTGLGIFVGTDEEASVGDSVGALVVASEGACDVVVDGVGVGASVSGVIGAVLGESVGPCWGSVGERLGRAEAMDSGDRVGDGVKIGPVGDSVSAGVGSSVKLSDGVKVGTSGVSVGIELGTLEEDSVGD